MRSPPEMITSYHGGNTSLSNFPFRAPFRTPRCLGWGGGGGGGGGRISKGSGFCIYALLLNLCFVIILCKPIL